MLATSSKLNRITVVKLGKLENPADYDKMRGSLVFTLHQPEIFTGFLLPSREFGHPVSFFHVLQGEKSHANSHDPSIMIAAFDFPRRTQTSCSKSENSGNSMNSTIIKEYEAQFPKAPYLIGSWSRGWARRLRYGTHRAAARSLLGKSDAGATWLETVGPNIGPRYKAGSNPSYASTQPVRGLARRESSEFRNEGFAYILVLNMVESSGDLHTDPQDLNSNPDSPAKNGWVLSRDHPEV